MDTSPSPQTAPSSFDRRPDVPEAPLSVLVPKSNERERKRVRARRLRRAIGAVLAVLVVVGLVFALRPRPVPVDVARAAPTKLVVTIEESGVTRVKDRYIVSAPVPGTLARIGLEPGDEVAEGATIAEIAPLAAPLLDPRSRAEAEARLGAALSAEGQARAYVGRARAANELADAELDRTKRLAEGGALTAQSLEQAGIEARMRREELGSAEFGLKVATEQVRLARAALGRAGDRGSAARHVDVIAPVAGRILKIHHESAGVVAAGTPLVEVGDPSALEVVVDLLTTDAVNVRRGTKVVIGGWGGEPLAGHVHRVEPSAFTRVSALGVDEQRVNVLVDIADPRDRWQALGDGFRVEAELVLAELERALAVPLGAVFRHEGGWAVFRVDGDGKARLARVTIGHRARAQVEIRAGLEAGTTVVVHPGDRVRDGVTVEARNGL